MSKEHTTKAYATSISALMQKITEKNERIVELKQQFADTKIRWSVACKKLCEQLKDKEADWNTHNNELVVRIAELEQQLAMAKKEKECPLDNPERAIMKYGCSVMKHRDKLQAENAKHKAALEKIEKSIVKPINGNAVLVNIDPQGIKDIATQALKPECGTCEGKGKVSSQTSEQINVFGHLMPCPACDKNKKGLDNDSG